MNVPAAQEYLAGWHAHNPMIWEKLLQRFGGSAVMGIVECGHYNTAVGDVEIDV